MTFLAWVNAALYVLQLFVNGYSSRNIGPMSRKHETLITPAPYAFSIWGLIYTLLAVGVVADLFWPSASFYSRVAHPTLLRALFAVGCLMNMAWIVFFTNEWVNVATATLVVLWSALFVLYVSILSARREDGFELKLYVCSELGITLYFAWTCAATLISFAVTFQDFAQDYLTLTSYVAMVSLLAVATLSAVIYEQDVAFGLVAIWALVGIAAKDLHAEARIELVALNVRACATQSAAIIAAFILISLAHKFLAPKTDFAYTAAAAPLVSEKNAPHLDYGATPSV